MTIDIWQVLVPPLTNGMSCFPSEKRVKLGASQIEATKLYVKQLVC